MALPWWVSCSAPAGRTSGGVLGGLTGILFELALSKVLAVIVLATLALLSLLWTWGITLGSICRAIQNRPRPERPPRSSPGGPGCCGGQPNKHCAPGAKAPGGRV